MKMLVKMPKNLLRTLVLLKFFIAVLPNFRPSTASNRFTIVIFSGITEALSACVSIHQNLVASKTKV